MQEERLHFLRYFNCMFISIIMKCCNTACLCMQGLCFCAQKECQRRSLSVQILFHNLKAALVFNIFSCTLQCKFVVTQVKHRLHRSCHKSLFCGLFVKFPDRCVSQYLSHSLQYCFKRPLRDPQEIGPYWGKQASGDGPELLLFLDMYQLPPAPSTTDSSCSCHSQPL